MDTIHSVLASLLPSGSNWEVTRLCHEEDGEPYDVWRVDAGERHWILKKAKEYEYEVYSTFFAQPCPWVPRLEGTAVLEGARYLLEPFVPGHNLQRASRADWQAAMDALIGLQAAWWENTSQAQCCYGFAQSLPHCRNRGKYLNHPILEQAYQLFLATYEAVPRTLCHDDLLPFNVLVDGGRACFIDWEFAGILAYPLSLARLLAHGEDDPNAFFVLSEAERQHWIDYYYDNLLRDKGLSYPDYRRTLSLFFFYEYCEWIFVGNRYGNTQSAYYQRYLPMALRQAEKILAAAN